MTIQEFLSKLDASPFSDTAKAEVRSMLENVPELTPELKERVVTRLQSEVEDDLKDVQVDPEEAARLEAQLDADLTAVEQEATEDQLRVEREVLELSDMAQKIDVLERLHS